MSINDRAYRPSTLSEEGGVSFPFSIEKKSPCQPQGQTMEKSFASAIAQLETSLDIAETNAPIWEKEGNADQAAVSREHAQSFTEALSILRESKKIPMELAVRVQMGIEFLNKFSDDQARDSHGRVSIGGDSHSEVADRKPTAAADDNKKEEDRMAERHPNPLDKPGAYLGQANEPGPGGLAGNQDADFSDDEYQQADDILTSAYEHAKDEGDIDETSSPEEIANALNDRATDKVHPDLVKWYVEQQLGRGFSLKNPKGTSGRPEWD